MLAQLLRYKTEASALGEDFAQEIQRHFDAIFPEQAGLVFDEARIATQFGDQILIEPGFVVQDQLSEQLRIVAEEPRYRLDDPPKSDPYDLLRPPGWFDGLALKAMRALSERRSARELLGVDYETIRGLSGPSRAGAFRLPRASVDPLGAPVDATDLVLDAAIAERLGPLGPNDRYFVPSLDVEPDPLMPLPPTACAWLGFGSNLEASFMRNLAFVRTFITNAMQDAVIIPRAIVRAIAEERLASDVAIDPSGGVARPGWIRMVLPPIGSSRASGKPIAIRFPTYEKSGHAVAVTEGIELANDVNEWWFDAPRP
jgi:hypothetical protein